MGKEKQEKQEKMSPAQLVTAVYEVLLDDVNNGPNHTEEPQIKQVIDAITDIVIENTKNDKKTSIGRLCTVYPSTRKPRTVKSDKTNWKPVILPKHRVAFFKQSAKVKSSVDLKA